MSFLPGLELSRRFHHAVVAPAIAARFPRLRYAAARMDTGSELFGFDTERSRDHDWGPRVQVFLDRADAGLADQVCAAVTEDLPATFLGFPTRFAPDADRTLGVPALDGARHGVTVTDVSAWCQRVLGFDPAVGPGRLDWLATPTQRLAEFTAGDVFHDALPELAARSAEPTGGLTGRRAVLAWYPPDIWRYVLAAAWARVAGEEPFVGRCGEVGDEIGGAVVTARIVRDLMRLALLVGRCYPPYHKWLGSAFARLPDDDGLCATLAAALSATGWSVRQRRLCQAYELLAVRTNQLALAAPVEPTVRPFRDRPFLVLDAARFARALWSAIGDRELRALPVLGAVDQVVDHTALLTDVARTRTVMGCVLGLDHNGTRPNER
ncbi:DUF4037 domain-containing protein [Solwaraspora sp. WMMD937]|uniref:DUF4037 domain-containing protein n=1 Tax=Solwaraspora sp. WMMD937 TaxID=3016090 RepID=UPI00249BA5D7|nr:DUF4037 domain-containing protein [Solwaraspora sp. WMMD937]WFE20221.1 DUF4037 domain-containing protein [Solwaraspora sp. WMMD937]